MLKRPVCECGVNEAFIVVKVNGVRKVICGACLKKYKNQKNESTSGCNGQNKETVSDFKDSLKDVLDEYCFKK